jgi:hypothetical protein
MTYTLAILTALLEIGAYAWLMHRAFYCVKLLRIEKAAKLAAQARVAQEATLPAVPAARAS